MLKKIFFAGAFALLCSSQSYGQFNVKVKSFQKISNGKGGFGNTITSDDRFGNCIADIGDLDGDGIDDIAVGADDDDAAGTDAGKVYILFMKADKTVKSMKTITLNGQHRVGLALTNMGDLDGDGVQDILAGAIANNNYAGAINIVYLNTDGSAKSVKTIDGNTFNFTTLAASDIFGSSACNMGDFDGDGVKDIAVGAIGNSSDKGGVYLIYLNANGSVKGYSKIDGSSTVLGSMLDGGDLFGASVANVGDIDGDGVTDMAVGASRDDDGGTDCGAVYILMMNSNGTVKSAKKISASMSLFSSVISAGDFVGYSLCALKNYKLGGKTTIAVGTNLEKNGSVPKGAVYLISLDNTGSAVAYSKLNDNSRGFSGQLGNDDRFGSAIAEYSKPNANHDIQLIVGAGFDDEGSVTNAGSIYMLNIEDSNYVDTTTHHSGIQYHNTAAGIVSIYPNPASGSISVSMPSLNSVSTLSIYSIEGKLVSAATIVPGHVKDIKSIPLDISALQNGLYIMQVSNNDLTATMRFIKN